jgi:hypothetical protein
VEIARMELQVRFPLYVLVTKSDLITGFADYFPPQADLKSSFQIVGWSNPQDPRNDDSPTTRHEVRNGLDELCESLRIRRTSRLRQAMSPREDAQRRIDHLDEMFAFPASIVSMLDNLEEFVALLLERVGTVTPPFMRGVYFTSALQTGHELDFELQRALRVERLPESRRGASDRAYFIRDLFLDKIIPESGMVTPLQDVVAATRNRGRILVTGSFIAAAVVFIGTIVGYLQTAGKFHPHEQVWKMLEQNDLKNLQLFDNDGTYQGDHALTGATSKTVLDLHHDAVDLLAQNRDPASWLLPVSDDLNQKRRLVQREIFTQSVLVPAFNPILKPAPDGHYSAQQLLLLCNALKQLHGKLTYADFSRISEAAVTAESHSGISSLFADWQNNSGSLSADVIPENVTNKLSRDIQAILVQYVKPRRKAIESSVSAERAFLRQVRKLSDTEKTQILESENRSPLNGLVLDSETTDLLKSIDSQWPTQISQGSVGSRWSATLDNQKIDQNVLDLVKTEDDRTRYSELAAALYDPRLSTGTPAVQWNDPDNQQLTSVTDASNLEEFDRQHLGSDPSHPLIVRRFALYARMSDWNKKQYSFKDFPHPFLQLPDVLKQIAGDYQQQFDAASDPALGDRPVAGFKELCANTLKQTRISHEVDATRIATADPEHVWTRTPEQLKGVKPIDYIIDVQEDQDGTFQMSVPEGVRPGDLTDWTATLKAVNESIPEEVFANLPELNRSMVQIKSCLQEYANGCYFRVWSEAVSRMQRRKLADWSDFDVFRADAASDTIQKSLDRNLNRVQEALKALLSPSVYETIEPTRQPNPEAEDLISRIRLSPSAELSRSVCAFVHRWKSDPAATRTELLRDPNLDQSLNMPHPGRSPSDIFWSGVSAAAIDMLITKSTPGVIHSIEELHKLTTNKFPICQAGTDDLGENDLQAFAHLVDLADQICPDQSRTLSPGDARRIRDLQLGDKPIVEESWIKYAAWIRTLNQFFQTSQTGEINFAKSGETKREGHWVGVYFWQGTDPSPTLMPSGYVDREGGLPPEPARFTFRSGKNLCDPIDLRLTKSIRERDGAFPIEGFEFKRPWSLLHLMVSRQPGPDGYEIAFSKDPNPKAKLIVNLSFKDSKLQLEDMPQDVPPVPKIAEPGE